MAQKNETDIKDEGVTVTTTPKITISASATAKLAASADLSIAFNNKTTTSLVALDNFSFGGLGITTSKKIGPTVTYQCGKNAENFATSHKNKAYTYTKDLTFSYINGMALRGKSINIVNKTDIKTGAEGALAMLAMGSFVAPAVSFGVNGAGMSKDWETSAEKKKRKDQEKLDDQKAKVESLNKTIDDQNAQISELQQKESAGTITDEEQQTLKKLQDDVQKKIADRDSIKSEIDKTEKKKQKDKETSDNIGGAPDKNTSQLFSTVFSAAGVGTSVIAAGKAIAATLIDGDVIMDKGICMTASGGEFVMNATASVGVPKFCLEAYDTPLYANKKAYLNISAEAMQQKKLAEFKSLKKFLAQAGKNTSMICEENSVKLKQTSNYAQIKSTDVVLQVGKNSIKINNSRVAIKVGSGILKISDSNVVSMSGLIVQK